MRTASAARAVPRLAVAAAALLAMPARAQPENFLVEPAHTYPYFEVSHLGISTHRGRFDSTRGTIVLDRDAGQGAIDITIDASLVSTGNGLLDAVLRGEDFFDTAHFPVLTFRSRQLTFADGIPKRATGDFTMHGVTRPVELAIERFACTRLPFFVRLTCGADVTASIRRSDFGMTGYATFVGDEVKLVIQIEAVREEREPQAVPSGG